VLVYSRTEDPRLELMQQSLQQFVDQGPEWYDYFKVLDPVHEADIGGVPALSVTARITWNERVMVKSVYTCIANHSLYQIESHTDDIDWNNHQDPLDTVLASFTFAADNPAQ
jgi:hypothetical protein